MQYHKFVFVAALCGGGLFHGDSSAQELGAIPAGGFRSPEGDARFAPEAGVKPLNNLVFELLNREAPGAASYEFRNPREGWVYVRVSSDRAEEKGAVRLDDESVSLKLVNGQLEAMRYVPAGTHTISLAAETSSANRLEVRAIGELFYATYGQNPHIEETGIYSWQYLREHCLDHYNSIIGVSTVTADGKTMQEAEIEEWTKEGKKWFTSESVPYHAETVEAAYEHWAQGLGMRHPRMSGIWADEFGVGEKYGKKTVDMYPIWNEAIRKLRANPQHANRMFYAYSPSRLLPHGRFEEMVPFVHTLLESGYRIGPEWYLPEGQSRPGRVIEKTDDLLAEFSPGWEQASRESFEWAGKGAATERIINLSLFSEPGWETSDIFPDYDFNVFLDAQMQFIATDPAFFGVRGLQGYLSGYCGEEQTRLFAKLVRHYAIEGNTKRFLNDPYVLTHVQNGDFTDGSSGWTITAAVNSRTDQSIAPKTVPGLGTLEGRYHAPPNTGDTALWTRRSESQPNVISQQIRNLIPGKVYSLRFLTGDYQELQSGKSVRRKHAASATIGNVDRIDAKCFQAEVASGFWYGHGGFNANNPYWLNYHQHVFRAKGDTAELRLSDWSANEAAGGPAGEELLWNFVQVQPYFE